jgi:hypothetical protein
MGLAFFAGFLLLGPSVAPAGNAKVQICHVPPGNPSNRHTISVAPKAAEAHLANHADDHLGECPPACGSAGACEDGDPCTIDGCSDGFCDFSQPVDCDEGSVCTTNVCISDQGGCVEIPANEGGECDDDAVCTGPDTCQSGVCTGPEIPDCCRNDAHCSDGTACTDNICDEATGVCSNPDVVCPDPPACTVSICDAQSGCTSEDVICADDGDLCTTEFCDPDVGATGGCLVEDVNCSDGEECNPDTGACEASGACEEGCNLIAAAVLEECLDGLEPGGDEASCVQLAREISIKCIADNCEDSCDDCPAGEEWDPVTGVCTPSQSNFSEAQWQITGNGVDPRAGTIDTSAPGSTPSVEVFAFPPGSNYSVDMSTTSEDGGLTCAGESIFDVHAGETTETRLILDCFFCSMQQLLGEVRVGGSDGGACTLLTGGVVSPLQTSVGNDIDLSAIAADAEGDPIAYLWTATGGSIDDPTSMNTTYTCAEVGEHTVTIAVSDDGFEVCIDQWTVPVRCVSGDGS